LKSLFLPAEAVDGDDTKVFHSGFFAFNSKPAQIGNIDLRINKLSHF
jgi:hypothetical protein